MKLIDISIDHVAPNLSKVYFGDFGLWFSYTTPIAVTIKGLTYITEKKYSKTTSKHTKMIADLSSNNRKVTHTEFSDILDQIVE